MRSRHTFLSSMGLPSSITQLPRMEIPSSTAGSKSDAARRVLVVDDEKNIRLTLSEALASEDVGVETAESGAEALAKIGDLTVALVLLDLKMPDLNGLDVLRRMRAVRPDLPVVVFTAHGSTRSAVAATKLGAVGFAEKPPTPEAFRSLVREHLGEGGQEPVRRKAREATSRRPYRAIVFVEDPTAARPLLRLAAASVHSREIGMLIAVYVIEAPNWMPLESYLDASMDEQRALLQAAERRARDLSIGLDAQVRVGYSTTATVLNLIEEEKADHVVLRWPERHGTGPFGSAARKIMKKAGCEVTLAKTSDRPMRNVAALITDSPHATLAARRAFEFARSAGVARLTLLNVRPPAQTEDAEQAGHLAIRAAAEGAGLPVDKYTPEVLIAEPSEEGLREALRAYDTICIGASRRTAAARVLFGSFPKTVSKAASGTVAVVRGAHRANSVRS